MITLTAAALAASMFSVGQTAASFDVSAVSHIAGASIAMLDDEETPPAENAKSDIEAAAADAAMMSKEEARLISAFTRIFQIFQQNHGILPSDMVMLERLRDDMTMFNLRWPNNQKIVALELQCSRWLGDRDRVDQLFGELVELNPNTPAMSATWAEDLIGRNDYERALDVVDHAKQKAAEVPVLQFLKVKCLYALNRFEEAKEAMEALPEVVQLKPVDVAELAQYRRVIPQYIEYWNHEQELRSAQQDNPIVTLETDKGTIKIELFEDDAPIAVKNFVTLCETGFYDGTKFHRVESGHVTQGGDPFTKEGATGVPGTGGPGYTITDEFKNPDGRIHFAGSVGMAHGSNPNSAGSQFYICHQPKPNLNGGYTVFGRVIEGMDVALNMEVNDKLISAVVTRKRDHAYNDFPKIDSVVPAGSQPNKPVLKPVDPPPGAEGVVPGASKETPDESEE